jgi:hypothetical protein
MCHAQLQGFGNPSTATGLWLLVAAAAAASLLRCWLYPPEVTGQQLTNRVQESWETIVTARHEEDWVVHWNEARRQEGVFQLLQA